MNISRAKEIAHLSFLYEEMNENVNTLQNKFATIGDHSGTITILEGCGGGKEIDIPKDFSQEFMQLMIKFHEEKIDGITKEIKNL
jgi:hypothetical protein